MRNLFAKLWNDDEGLVVLEYLIAATVLTLALIVGLVALEASINSELAELGEAVLGLNQGFSIATQTNCKSSKAGSNVIDINGLPATRGSVASGPPQTLTFNACP